MFSTLMDNYTIKYEFDKENENIMSIDKILYIEGISPEFWTNAYIEDLQNALYEFLCNLGFYVNYFNFMLIQENKLAVFAKLDGILISKINYEELNEIKFKNEIDFNDTPIIFKVSLFKGPTVKTLLVDDEKYNENMEYATELITYGDILTIAKLIAVQRLIRKNIYVVFEELEVFNFDLINAKKCTAHQISLVFDVICKGLNMSIKQIVTRELIKTKNVGEDEIRNNIYVPEITYTKYKNFENKRIECNQRIERKPTTNKNLPYVKQNENKCKQPKIVSTPSLIKLEDAIIKRMSQKQSRHKKEVKPTDVENTEIDS